jgi:peptidoglycan/xylan/chitin deacetylase (PgdA/CDA1 family)
MDDRSYLIIAPLENVKEDMVKNRDLFNARYFAYPFGQYNRSVIEILKETGHRLAFTTKKGYLTPNTKPYEIPRFAINREITGEEFDDIINGRR